MPTKRHSHSHRKKETVERISMSLPPDLLSEFDRSMKKAGFSDRSKAIQTALHSFVAQYDWDKGEDSRNGAGTITMLYDNHAYNHDSEPTHIQHHYSDIISASTHLHLDHDNCLETVMVKGEIRRIKELAKKLSENRGIKSLKVHFVSIV
ncbi:MAG TPA: nickel-responsive transcriptional regulator NikR [Nitrososphaera sp.]|nr:nickel-responsive transcriptional regulator NikR [Nitrososphaera sp.]